MSTHHWPRFLSTCWVFVGYGRSRTRRLLCVQPVSLFWRILFTHTIHTCISGSHGSKLLPTKRRPRSRNLSGKNQVNSLSVTVHPTSPWVCHLNRLEAPGGSNRWGHPNSQSLANLPIGTTTVLRQYRLLWIDEYVICILPVVNLKSWDTMQDMGP